MKYLIFMIFIVFFSCKKDNNNINIPMCYENYGIVKNENVTIDCSCPSECQELLPGTRYDYFYPSFNPNNENEFVYIRYDNTQFSLDYDLYKFDLCSQEVTLIYDDALGFADWSVKDWIIFTASNQMIYKVKSSGDSLTQLTFSGNFNRRPTWNPDGTKYSYNTQTGSNNYNIIANENGVPIDTVEFHLNAWGENDLFAFSQISGIDKLEIGYYDLNLEERIVVHTIENLEINFEYARYAPNGRKWVDNNIIFWTTKEFVGVTDIRDGKTEIVLEGFDNRQFELSTISKNGQFAILNRIDIETTDSTYCQIDTKYGLYLLDIESKTEKWINIPE